jgi:hypothetical protein
MKVLTSTPSVISLLVTLSGSALSTPLHVQFLFFMAPVGQFLFVKPAFVQLAWVV